MKDSNINAMKYRAYCEAIKFVQKTANCSGDQYKKYIEKKKSSFTLSPFQLEELYETWSPLKYYTHKVATQSNKTLAMAVIKARKNR